MIPIQISNTRSCALALLVTLRRKTGLGPRNLGNLLLQQRYTSKRANRTKLFLGKKNSVSLLKVGLPGEASQLNVVLLRGA
jgi:hypothetical protein